MEATVVAERMLKQTDSLLAPHQGQAEPHRNVLTGKHARSPVLQDLMQKIDSGQAGLHELARGYKHAPHSPVGLLYKYIAHRSNNLDAYDDSVKAARLDKEFFASNGMGLASESHKDVTPYHLNFWLKKNPKAILESLAHRDELQKFIKGGGAGLNVREIGGEPYVALTRGLNSEFFGPQMSLSSHADVPYTDFGKQQYHLWTPLKNVWYGYPLAPSYPRGEHGHEDEWIVSNQGPLYTARPEDIATNVFATVDSGTFPPLFDVLHTDDATAARMVAEGRLSLGAVDALHRLNLLGPQTLGAALATGLDPSLVANHPSIPRDMALRLADETLRNVQYNLRPLRNPNLTPEDLKNLVAHPHFAISMQDDMAQAQVAAIASHPNFNEAVCEALIGRIFSGRKDPSKFLPVIAKRAKTPVLALHKALINGLQEGDDSSWYPEWAVANCFSREVPIEDLGAWDPINVPTAFNNSHNGDRYLRALTEFFRNSPERASNAQNIYHKFLTGARLTDGTVQELLNLADGQGLLPGVESNQDQRMLLHEMARFNIQLSPRQMIIIAQSSAGQQGLVDREGSLPISVQMAIVEQTDDDNALFDLLERPDFAPEVADAMLKVLRDKPVERIAFQFNPIFLAQQIASNLKIPMETISKYIEHKGPEDQTPFERALAVGLAGRVPVQHILKPLPGGA